MPSRHFQLPAHFQPPQARTLNDADEALEEYTMLYKASERIDIGDTSDVWDPLLRVACNGRGDYWSEALAWRLLATMELTPSAGRDMIESALVALRKVSTDDVDVEKVIMELKLLKRVAWCFRKTKAAPLNLEYTIDGMLADLARRRQEEEEAAAANAMYVEDDGGMDVEMEVDHAAEQEEESDLAAALDSCRLHDEMQE